MEQLPTELLIYMSIIAPILTALVQALKRAFKLPKNYIPLITAGLGLLIGLIPFPFMELTITMTAWGGFIAGLGGTGLFEVVRQKKN
ncbi:A118-like holin Hol118 [Sinobaca qinghaiensis]|uniref:A118-like holin Hol118 n=1 Tax=Sinobaca qinghaiensis TaxID=342944 RepID=A0A419V5H0_9BACL|nr:holin [Sinobaca qinghaiensis]RKD75210.1 A118-like holin Hol118 [Sinobaca qinghaiensis]